MRKRRARMEENMAELKKFRLEVISPERVFYTGDVEMVELTTIEGEIGEIGRAHV